MEQYKYEQGEVPGSLISSIMERCLERETRKSTALVFDRNDF